MKNLSVFLLCIFLLGSFVSAQEILTRSNGTKIIIYNDHTWKEYENNQTDFDYDSLKTGKIPDFLRSGIGVEYQTLRKAVELYLS